MEQQLKQCPKTGVYYYVDVPEDNDEVVLAGTPVEAPKPKMGRPKKR